MKLETNDKRYIATLPEAFRAHAEAHLNDVQTLSQRPEYKSRRYAEKYIETRLGELWRSVLSVFDDDTPLVEALGLSETMVLILQLYGRAVHRHGTDRSNIPVIHSWIPVTDKTSEVVRYPRAISKRSIGRIIGKSQSAVDQALRGFKGSRERFELLFDRRVAFPLSVDTGIMLDLMTSRQCAFSFMHDDYEYARSVALDRQHSDSPFNHKTREWCREALSKGVGAPAEQHEYAAGEVAAE